MMIYMGLIRALSNLTWCCSLLRKFAADHPSQERIAPQLVYLHDLHLDYSRNHFSDDRTI